MVQGTSNVLCNNQSRVLSVSLVADVTTQTSAIPPELLLAPVSNLYMRTWFVTKISGKPEAAIRAAAGKGSLVRCDTHDM
ncbi:hypothetical protein T440DRAFT_469215, partial [Plenodomus tracheiphilus IPT5]